MHLDSPLSSFTLGMSPVGATGTGLVPATDQVMVRQKEVCLMATNTVMRYSRPLGVFVKVKVGHSIR
jgi:hypothetical protein